MSFKKAMPNIAPISQTDSADVLDTIESGNWHLFLQFNENCLRDGLDPLLFIRYLNTLGEIVELSTFSQAMPDAERMNPETSYLAFQVILKSGANKQAIEDVFEFVRTDSIINILPVEHRIPFYAELFISLDDGITQLGELLLDCGVITLRELEDVLKSQQKQTTGQYDLENTQTYQNQ
jgi:two-component system chemotaxis sensor kinase CheA